MSLDDACRRWRPEVARAVPSASDDFIDELTGHVAQRWLDARARGRTDAEADHAARVELKSWTGVAPPTRPPASRLLIGTGQDVRLALRMLRWRPSFAIEATLLAAIAVATASALVAIVYGVLGRPLPYPHADRLVTLWEASKDGPTQVSYPNYLDLRASGAFELAAAFAGGTGTFSGGSSVERVKVLQVEPAMLTMLGAAPLRGRLLQAADAGSQVGLISHRLWITQFGGHEDIVGRTFLLSGRPQTIVGVLQPGFDFELPVARTFLLSDHDVWQPFDSSSPTLARRDVSTYQVLARLGPGVTIDQASAAATTVATSLASRYPETNQDRSFQVSALADAVVEAARGPIRLAALGGVILVLAALANLGSLALSRFGGRQSDLAVRQALGASRGRLIRQLITEHLPIVGAGAVLGVAGGALATAMVAGSSGVRLPRPDAIRFDTPAIATAIVVSVIALGVLAVMPLIVTRRTVLSPGARRVAGPATRRSRRILVAAEITIALVLCSSAALVALTLMRLLNVDPGFATAGRLTFRVSAYASQHPGKAETMRFFSELLDRLAALPGVAGVAAGSSLPLSGQFSGIGILSDSTGQASAERIAAGWQFVTPGFFAATGTPLQGRDFTSDEWNRDAHVTILNAELARRLFGTTNPIGRRVQVGGGDDWHEVIGVAGNVRHRSLREPPQPRVYDLAGQHWGRTMYVVVHSKHTDTSSLRDAVVRTTADIDSQAPVFELSSVEALLSRSVATERIASIVASGTGALALLLAVLGVHAVVSCSVVERRREMGVRAALGATPIAIVRLVLMEAGLLAVAGGLAGLAGAWGVARMLSTHLYAIDATHVWPIILITGVAVAIAAVLAALPPSWRAASVDTSRALQE